MNDFNQQSQPSENSAWATLQSEWQSYEPDIKNIQRKIDWVTWRMGAILTMDVLFAILYFPFMYFEVTKADFSWVVDGFNILISLFIPYGIFLDFKLRLPIFRCQGNSTQEVLSFYLKRLEVGVVIGRVSKNVCWLLLGGFLIWVVSVSIWSPETTKITRWSFIMFGICWISLFALLSAWYQQKKHREFEHLKSLWKDYLE